MTQIERILHDIETLPDEQQKMFFDRLADFEFYRNKQLVKQQKLILQGIIGIGQGEKEHPNHDQVHPV